MISISGIKVGYGSWKIAQNLKGKELELFVKTANVNKDTKLTKKESQKAWDNYQSKLAVAQAPAVTQVNAENLSGASLMDQIGESYDVTLANGVKSKCAVITLAKLDEFCKAKGIDWRKVLNENYGKYKSDLIKAGTIPSAFYEVEPNYEANGNQGCVHRGGYLVNLDLYQQAALLRAIVARCPEYKDSIGLYNLKASDDVYRVIDEAGLRKKNIYWFWTGEKYKGRDLMTYDVPGLVTADGMKKENVSTSSRFCSRMIILGEWFGFSPDSDNFSSDSVFVLGGLK